MNRLCLQEINQVLAHARILCSLPNTRKHTHICYQDAATLATCAPGQNTRRNLRSGGAVTRLFPITITLFSMMRATLNFHFLSVTARGSCTGQRKGLCCEAAVVGLHHALAFTLPSRRPRLERVKSPVKRGGLFMFAFNAVHLSFSRV